MKELPVLPESLNRIYEQSLSLISANALAAGVKLSVFDNLREPVTAESLAKKQGLNPGATQVLLDTLAACGHIEKKDGLYRNMPDTNCFLVSDSPAYYGGILLREYQRNSMSPDTIVERVKSGPVPQSHTDDMCNEGFWESYARSMANWERAGTAQILASVISGLPEFSSFRTMLDLGGGPGLIGIAVLKKHPSMTGVVFDQPSVIPVTKEFISAYDMDDRMSTLGGNYLKDSFGEGYDLVFCSCTLNFAKHCMGTMIQRIYDALSPGGVFVSLHDGMVEEGTSPRVHVLNMMTSALSGFSCSLDKGFIVDAMKIAGFSTITSKQIVLDVGPFELDIGIKEKAG
jgi:predicted O-methyltransferase YrrM